MLDGVEPGVVTLADLDKQVADLNARFDGWTFVLPAYKYAAFDKSLADLLKPVAAKADANGKPDKKKTAPKMPTES